MACALSLGCSPAAPDPRILTEPLRVDVEFDAEQQAAAQAAVNLWSDATHGRFAPVLTFEAVQCGDAFAVEAVRKPSCSVGQEAMTSDGLSGRVLGSTDPEHHSVAVAAWLAGSGFRDTFAHELGHYLLLGHGEGIMSERRGNRGSEISEASIADFCDIWGC